MKTKQYNFLCISLFAISMCVSAQVDNLDPEFGNEGINMMQLFSGNNVDEFPEELILQPDGKIIVAGWVENFDMFAPFYSRSYIMRLNSDGSFDNSFGNGGIDTSEFGIGGFGEYKDFVLHPSGKITTFGYSYDSTGYNTMIFVRYNANGKLDNSFNGNGFRRNYEFINYTSMALGSQEKMVLAGRLPVQVGGFFDYKYNWIISRYDSCAVIDSSFNGTGSQIVDFPDNSEPLTDVVIDHSDRIVASGFYDNDIYHHVAGLLRCNTDGTMDNSFADGGLFSYSKADNVDCELSSLTIQEDGKIIAIGYSDEDLLVLRLNDNGTLDNTFGTGGIAVPPENLRDGWSKGSRAAIQPDGKIIVSGLRIYRNDLYDEVDDFFVIRFNSNGTIDNTFGKSGMIITEDDINPYFLPKGMVLQTDGNIVLAGMVESNLFLARYLPVQSAITDVKETEQNRLFLYPNPAKDFVFLNFDNDFTGTLKWQIIDLAGEIIRNGYLKDSSSGVSVGGLMSSVYFFQITNTEGSFSKTFKLVIN